MTMFFSAMHENVMDYVICHQITNSLSFSDSNDYRHLNFADAATSNLHTNLIFILIFLINSVDLM